MPSAVRVLFPLPLPPFTYLAPFEQEAAQVGCRVVVPWHSSVRIGLVVGTEEVAALKALELREYICVLDSEAFVLEAQVSFILELAKQVCSPPGRVLAQLAATGFNEDLSHEVQRVAGADDVPLPDTWTDVAQIELPKLDTFRQQGLVRERVHILPQLRRVLVPLRRAGDELSGKPQVAQKKALGLLWQSGSSLSGAELARTSEVSESAVRALVKKGYAGYEERPAPPPALPTYAPLELARQPEASLPNELRAVTGGLRQSRLAALLPRIKTALEAEQSVLVLVPEQVLLAETASYLSASVPTQVLSGDLNDVQRKRFWEELPLHTPVVLVGSYLALLAPLGKPGLVVVLEEGSSSYKLHSGPRLFVPAAARLLANCLDAELILTDALLTPETLALASAPKRLSLATPKPRLHISDLTSGSNWPLSADLVQVLKQVAERERQAVILAPRRGFSAALGCSSCGWLSMCPNCDLPLRYHQRRQLLQCHQCGFRSGLPNVCESCEATTLGPLRGAGTQWIMNEIKVHLGDFPLYQYDADTRDDLSELVAGEAGIVVATTAILRHDLLPNVSLIAMTLFDTLLGFSDFRAEEEALRLLLGLAELAPGKRPLTLLQTFQPEHSLLKTLLEPDLETSLAEFMAQVMARREQFKYPPFVDVAKIQVSARQDSVSQSEAERLANTLELYVKEQADILGPNPAPVTRLRGLYNYQIFVRDLVGEGFEKLLEPATSFQGRAKVRVDVDPRDIGGFLS